VRLEIVVATVRDWPRFDAVTNAESPAIVRKHADSTEERLFFRMRTCLALFERLWLCNWS
jgi:hypothetical protein